jgi:hypothetical protein
VNKAIIVSVFIGGMLTNIAPSAIPTATAKPITTLNRTIAKTSPLTLQLLDAGTQPRRELKFTPAPNSKQTLTMEMGMNMEMAMDGRSIAPPTKLPKTVMKPNGNIHYDFVYADASVVADTQSPKELISAMQKSMKTLVGLKGSAIMTSRGTNVSQKLVLPPNMATDVKQFMNQLNNSLDRISTLLPVEAVGIGAKWTTNVPLEVAGMKLNQKIDYEVLALNAEGATIQTKVSQSAPPQNMQIPGVPKDVKIRLNSLTSQGEGKMTLRFNSLLPVQAKTTIDTDADMSLPEKDSKKMVNMKQKTSIDLNMSSN